MQPVFTRLNCSSTKEVLQELWDRRLIALHYEDSFSLNPDDYPTAGKHALSRLHRYAREGAVVAADFRKLYRDRLRGDLMPVTPLVTRDRKIFRNADTPSSGGQALQLQLVRFGATATTEYSLFFPRELRSETQLQLSPSVDSG